MTILTVSQQIDAYIANEGKGNVRDALNVALAHLDRSEALLADYMRNFEKAVVLLAANDIEYHWIPTLPEAA